MRLRPLARLTFASAVLLVAFGAVVAGCESEQQNGQECLKDDDCVSKRCVAYVCIERITDAGADTGSAADAPAESATDAPAESATDTGTADTGTADTGTADTGTADTGTATDAADGG